MKIIDNLPWCVCACFTKISGGWQ